MTKINALLLLFALFLPALSRADAEPAGLAGTYNGGGHFGTVTITPRGPNYLLSTCGNYTSLCLQITAELTEKSPGEFATVLGAITIFYGNLRCDYPVSLRVVQDVDTIYLSEFGPGTFPNQSVGCPRRDLLRYGNYVEPKPYLRSK